jgi:hypothetical protein
MRYSIPPLSVFTARSVSSFGSPRKCSALILGLACAALAGR